MRGTKLLLIIALITRAAFAQHGGALSGGVGRAAGPATVRPSPTGSPRFGVVGGRNRARLLGGFGYGLGYGWPYFPAWDYDLRQPLYYGDDFASEYPQYPYLGNALIIPPAPELPAPPPKPASSVIHEYNFGTPVPPRPGERTTFTIVLKDGSTRAAAASWVSGGRLHYLDPQSRQQVLAPEVIDREATERANEAKNLSMELPPG
jgi:hypothetical protein